jgi:hypothetical protein
MYEHIRACITQEFTMSMLALAEHAYDLGQVHDFLKQNAPNLKRYKSAPISGFFLDHTNVLGDAVYGTMMQHLFTASNASAGVNRNCIAAMKPADQWKCNFASGSYAYTQAPIFALNSALDSWQTGCIYTATLDPGFPKTTPKALDEHGNCGNAGANFSSASCSGKPRAECKGPWTVCARDPEQCSGSQIEAMNEYISDFDAIMGAASAYSKPGNGAFIHSCHTHCEAQGPDWNKFSVNGTTIQEAVHKWWYVHTVIVLSTSSHL